MTILGVVLGLGMASMHVKFPLGMGVVLLLTAFFCALVAAFSLNMVWVAYIFFVVMVGGVLVLFLYMAAISPSDGGISWLKVFGGFLLCLGVAAVVNVFMVVPVALSGAGLAMNAMYSHPLVLVVLLMALYLLVAFIVIVSVVYKDSGPLRLE